MKKFENSKTVVKGFIIDKKNGQATAFEATTAYVRSTEKAAKMIDVSEFGFEAKDVIVVVSECINEKATPKQYNTSKIYDLCENHFDDENAAKEYAEVNNLEMRAIPWFTIGGQIWATDNNGEYITEYFMSDSPLNLTKCDMRNVLSFDFENVYTGYDVIATHNETKEQTTRYCAISKENLEKCVKVSEK